MLEELKWKYQEWILKQFKKYYTVGGHCGLCGKWVDNAIVDKDWEITVCEECGSKTYLL